MSGVSFFFLLINHKLTSSKQTVKSEIDVVLLVLLFLLLRTEVLYINFLNKDPKCNRFDFDYVMNDETSVVSLAVPI